MNNISIEILYEDNHLIAVNKKAGEIVQGDKTGDEPLSEKVKKLLKIKYKKPGNVFLGTIHRIDRPTSGVIVFAKTSKALSRMNEKFRENEIHKTYLAAVKNKLPKNQDIIECYLQKNQKINKSFISNKVKGKYSKLEYKEVKKLDNYYIYKITPYTGRHHQIRVQLSSKGSPIKGDLKYGAKRSNKNLCIHLHSRQLILFHPVTKEKLKFVAKCPKDSLWESCEGVDS